MDNKEDGKKTGYYLATYWRYIIPTWVMPFYMIIYDTIASKLKLSSIYLAFFAVCVPLF